MNKSAFMRRLVAVGTVVGSAGSVLAEGAFDPATTITTATTSVEGIATAIAGLLGAAILLYVGFVGYRKGREALNKV